MDSKKRWNSWTYVTAKEKNYSKNVQMPEFKRPKMKSGWQCHVQHLVKKVSSTSLKSIHFRKLKSRITWTRLSYPSASSKKTRFKPVPSMLEKQSWRRMWCSSPMFPWFTNLQEDVRNVSHTQKRVYAIISWKSSIDNITLLIAKQHLSTRISAV